MYEWLYTAGKDELLIVPLEVEVSERPGLYSPQHMLDFGVLHSETSSASLPLFVINSSTKPVEITVSADSSITVFGYCIQFHSFYWVWGFNVY